MKKLLSTLHYLETRPYIWFIVFTLFLFSVLRIPSLFEPDWYGDEGIYQVLGMGIRHDRLLYREVWDNKPPVLYLIYALVDGDLFGARLFSLIFGIFAVIFFFLLARSLFRNKTSLYISVVSFAVLFGLPLLEGNIANAENFMLVPIILSGLIIFSHYKDRAASHVFWAGILLSLAFLTKIVAMFDFIAFFIFLIIAELPHDLSYPSIISFIMPNYLIQKLRNELKLIISFVIPIALTLLFFMFHGALSDYIRAAFSQNVGYVGYGNYFLFPMGFLLLKLILLGIVLLLLIRFRALFGMNGIFILTWLSFSFFNALFSQRPYTHYLLVMLPAFSLLTGLIWEKKNIRFVTAAIVIGIIFIVIRNFNLYTKTLAYYQNYISFMLGKKSVVSYQEFFDKITSRDYYLANFIINNTTDKDSVFLWSNSAQIYALSHKLPPGRYTVAYHVTFYEDAKQETKNAIEDAKAKYIIATVDTKGVEELFNHYILRFDMRGAKIYEREI